MNYLLASLLLVFVHQEINEKQLLEIMQMPKNIAI